ncbi:MAG: DMT family transporter [Pseudomonadota bacterium]
MSQFQTDNAGHRRFVLTPQGTAIAWILTSVAGATAMTLGVRHVSAEIHSVMLAFLRSTLALLPVIPVIWAARRPGGRPLRFTAWPLHLLRGLVMVGALNFGFYAIWKLPLATSTVLFFMAPIFATLFAMALLGERVGPRRWVAMMAAFTGAIVILRPDAGRIEPAMVLALISALCFGSVLVLGRMATDRDGPNAVFVSSSVIVAILCVPPALFFWELPSSITTWVLIVVVVVGSSLRSFADIKAYAIGDAGFLAPFSYLRLVTVGVAAYLLFGEVPDEATFLGGAIIVAATLYIALREAQLRRASTTSAAP